MLTEKRYEVILKCLNEKNSITVTELKELLGISESTIRRDLTALDKAGKLVKVFGGAVAVDSGFTTVEPSVAQKSGVNKEEIMEEGFTEQDLEKMLGWDANLESPVKEGYIITDNIITSISYNFVKWGLAFGRMIGIDIPPETFGI